MKILLYGFGPYRSFSRNVTQEIIARLPAIEQVETIVFDVRFDREMFERGFERIQPDVILGLGQHPRARKIRNERLARDAQAEDGKRPHHITGSGDLRMSLEIPHHELLTTTHNAGTYVCNFSMYVAEDYARRQGSQAGFLHIPRSVDVERAVQYLEELLHSLLDHWTDKSRERPLI